MRTAIIGSGKGTNCEAIIDAHSSGLLASCEIVGVFSDKQNSGILQIAKQAGVPHIHLGNYNLSNETDNDRWVSGIKKYRPDLIVLAGFMRILSNQFIQAFDSRIINLHPSLLPSFRGLNAVAQAWNAGVKITGCTVHWVSSELDCGKIIAQAPVRIMSSDTFESVMAKVQAAEHMLLPSVVAEISQGFHPDV